MEINNVAFWYTVLTNKELTEQDRLMIMAAASVQALYGNVTQEKLAQVLNLSESTVAHSLHKKARIDQGQK